VCAVLVDVLAMAVCLSVSVSVTSQSFIERDERIDLVFGMKASFDVSTATGVLLSVDQSPRVAWNSLPVALRSSDVTEETNRRHLKTFLFNYLDN